MRPMLVLAILATSASPSPSDQPKPSAADWIVGAWAPAAKGGHFPYVFFADGKVTADGGKAKGTYKVSEIGVSTVVEITLERDGKPLPPDKATICFPGKDRMVWYPEWEWKGVVLNRKQ